MSSDCVSTENKYFAGAGVVVATVFKFIRKLKKKLWRKDWIQIYKKIEKKLVEGGYGVLRGFSLGGFAPQTPHQGSSAPLDPPKYGPATPQDGLVTPPYGDYVRTSLKNVRNLWKMQVFYDFPSGRSNWLQITKNRLLRFLPFYPLILVFQALSCVANCRSWRDLSIGTKNS